jgi:uncharacterized protein involved in type VI secretion and phage assembly
LQFSGVITQVEAARHDGQAGEIIISGYSPTILLDNGPNCQSWEKKAVKGIATEVLQPFPQNLLKPKISPAYGETLSYTVQYRETAWQFLGRLSATYGEWLFYDGQKLVMGAPQGQKAKLVFGNNLHNFSMALQVRPASFEVMAYDYINHEVYSGNPVGIASKAGLNDFGKHTLQKSEKFYNTKPREWHNNFLTNKNQLDDFVNTRAMMQSSHMVRFNGKSEHPGVQVGVPISVDGKNVFSQADESFGDYHIINVHHHCDGHGNYTNKFTAIPASVKMPPVARREEPRCETQSAIVTDNNDPKGLGRIRVKFHWMAGTEKTPWLRMTGAHAGKSKGVFFIPEVGEEVIVGFEGDSAIKPYIIGTVFNGKAKNEFSNQGNDVKAIQTRSGNKVIMNDKEGSVLVEDKDGNNIKIDGAGNINIKSKESIVLACGEAKIELKKDGTINLTGKNITTNAQQKAKMVSGQAAFTADGQGNEAKMEGMKANVNGSMEAKVAGGAKTDVTASGNVTVKGALIMLN